MTRVVWIDGRRIALTPATLLAQGGEAEVYDVGDGRVVKWWKPPDHPDFAGVPLAQQAAKQRLAERPAKLRALPGNLPAAVVAPCGFALDGKRRAVGFVMPKVAGEPLHSFGEPRWRHDHPIPGGDVVAALRALHDGIAGLHAIGVVIGDCNDLNVLVDGRRVHLIDVDSYQFAGFRCEMYSERFVDPRLCDANGALVHPHDPASDWFAFAAMAFRTLLGVGPWGGVHQPADRARRCPPPARARHRISVYGSDIVYPRTARPLAILPDELNHLFRTIFERDQRTFARHLLDQLELRACPQCREEHGRARCPLCHTHQPATVIHSRAGLRWSTIDRATVDLPYTITRSTPIWLESGALWRSGALGRERIGNVLATQTAGWVGRRLGVGFYRAGGYAVGFVFRPDRGPLDDRVTLPAIRGHLVNAHATVGDDRAWLWLTTVDGGRMITGCVVIGADSTVITHQPTIDEPWLAGIAGALAVGPHLFVPTDDGVVRIEVVAGAIVQTRAFPETGPLTTSGDRLALGPPGSASLDVVRKHDAIRIQLT